MSETSPLPPLFAPMARSFWAQLLLFASVALNTAGVDLFGLLADMGLGRTPDEVVANGDRVVSAWQQLAPLIFGVWAWLERKAPKYRLVFRPKDVGVDLVGPGSSALVLTLALAAGLLLPGQARAGQCAGLADVMAGLATRYGERALWQGGAGDGVSFTVTVNPDGTTWTALMLRADGLACIVASGSGWTAGPEPKAQGEDG